MSKRDPCLNEDGSRKIRYVDQAAANREAARMTTTYGELYGSYYCPNKRHYHVGRWSRRALALRKRRRVYASELSIELGLRALAQLLQGDTEEEIGIRFVAAERRRHR